MVASATKTAGTPLYAELEQWNKIGVHWTVIAGPPGDAEPVASAGR